MEGVTRRRILYCGAVSSSGLLAGCNGRQGSSDDGEGESRTSTCDEGSFRADPETPPVPGEEFPTVAATATASSNRTDLRASARCVRAFSRNSPAQVRVVLSNVGNESATVGFGAHRPLTRYAAVHEKSTAELYLVPERFEEEGTFRPASGDADEKSETASGCWQLDTWGYDDVIRHEVIDPCESISGRYAVFAAGDNDGCLPAGRYHIEEHFNWPDDEHEAALSVVVRVDDGG